MPRQKFEDMDELTVRLKRLKRNAKKIGLACLNASMEVIEQEIIAAIPAAYKDAAGLVGHRVDRRLSGNQIVTGIVGWGVGKKRLHASQKDKGSGRVGITENTVHWFVLGTAIRRTRKGYNRGAMPPQLAGLLSRGISGGSVHAYAVAAHKYRVELMKALVS